MKINSMKRKVWYHVAVVFCLGLLACQSDDEKFEEASKEVVFRVVNYTQYNLDEVTRASADVLDHLVLGVFDAETDAMVGSLTVQNEGDTGYGTFSVRLAQGSYRLVFLGYDGTRACNMTSSSVVSFADDFVPQTFIYSTLLTVEDDAIPAQNIILNRAVGAFRLTLTDAEMPSEWVKMRFRFAGGSTKLNVQTGFGLDNTGRIYDISIPSNFQSREDRFMTVFLFIPEDEAPIDITVDALNSGGEVIHSRTFPAVPMKVNQLLNYTGEFFADPTSEFSATVTYNIEWGSEQTVNF